MPTPELIQIELESPSAQKKADQCLLLYQLTYLDRWEPREAVRSLLPRLRGNAVSKCAEIVHKVIMNGDVQLLDSTSFLMSMVEECIALFNRQFEYCKNMGIVFPPDVDGVSRAELRRVLPLIAKYTPVRSWQKVLGVERPIKQLHCRPDVQGINAHGFHTVGDIKYKSALEARYEGSTIEEFHWDPQFQQYPTAHRVDQSLGRDVPVYSTLLLVVGAPFRIKPVEWLYNQEQEAFFLQGAEALSTTIRGIKDGKILPRPAVVHRNNFGWCPMMKACMELHLDPELMKQFYVQMELPE